MNKKEFEIEYKYTTRCKSLTNILNKCVCINDASKLILNFLKSTKLKVYCNKPKIILSKNNKIDINYYLNFMLHDTLDDNQLHNRYISQKEYNLIFNPKKIIKEKIYLLGMPGDFIYSIIPPEISHNIFVKKDDLQRSYHLCKDFEKTPQKYEIYKTEIDSVIIDLSENIVTYKYNKNQNLSVSYINIKKSIKESNIKFENIAHNNDFDMIIKEYVDYHNSENYDFLKSYEEVFNAGHMKYLPINLIFSNEFDDIMKIYKYNYIKNELKLD